MAGRKPNTHFKQVPLEIAILKRQPDGKSYWVEAARDVKSATKRVHALAEQFPGEYVIVNKKTREEIAIRIAGQSAAASTFALIVN
jgi:hypothetical protein